MHMRIDQPRQDDEACGVDRLQSRCGGARFEPRRYAPRAEAKIGRA
jgi:hypothetical protein